MAYFYEQELKRPASFNFATDVIDYWAAHDPSGPAMHWVSQDRKTERKLSFRHFSRQSHRIAALLRDKLGVQQGEKMLMILPRLPEWWEVAVAGLRAGIVVCPATTLLVDKDIEYRCHRSEASVFVGDEVSVQKLLRVRQHCPSIKHVIQIGGNPASGVTILADALKSISKDASFTGPKPEIKSNAVVYFTSGTTGQPKMVQHNHISYPLAHIVTGKHWLRLKPGQLYWNLSEQGWAKAAWSFFGAWNCGAGLFVHDDRQAFSPRQTLDILHQYPITTFCAPPTAFRQLVLDEMRTYLKSHRPKALLHCTSAGEPLNPEVIRLWKKASGFEICEGYGQTETILVCGNFEGAEVRPGSMGKAFPGVPMHVVDDNGAESAVDTEGDIGLKVDITESSDFFGVFDGYLDQNGALDRRLRASKINGEAWYLTGDRATRDADGYFWFVGRNDDVINSSGYRYVTDCLMLTLPDSPTVLRMSKPAQSVLENILSCSLTCVKAVQLC